LRRRIVDSGQELATIDSKRVLKRKGGRQDHCFHFRHVLPLLVVADTEEDDQ
jgi:hypothetical protein